MLHHDCEEFNDDLRARPDQDLSLSSLFCVVDGLEGVAQNIHTNHGAAENLRKLVEVSDRR
jgi:hypothetical protein